MPSANANANATVLPVGTGTVTVPTVSTAQMIQNSEPFFLFGLGIGLSFLIPISALRFLVKRIYK